MFNRVSVTFAASLLVTFLSVVFWSQAAFAANDKSAKRAQVVSHWTAERRAAAMPRDLVIDNRGLGYLRQPDGRLVPHGHRIEATIEATPRPQAKPGDGGSNDTTPPGISNLDPAANVTIGASYTFSAMVTDDSGVRSVTFVIVFPSGSTQSFSPSNSGNTWSIGLSGFTDGDWGWYVEAKDRAKRGGNTATSETVNFTVNTGGGGGGGGGAGGTVVNERYTGGGDVQWAAGRIYFEMPTNKGRKRWAGYVCSGTVVNDGTSGRSTILTAAHCVYDDANGAFARNVLFIPNQGGTTGGGTDGYCGNDPIGCWVPSFGVVDINWTQSVFPDNIPWDYAFYVVDDVGAHSTGLEGNATPAALDSAVTALGVVFSQPTFGAFTHGMGYSYSDDPYFMYCAEAMTTEGAFNWWLASCGLSGGSSGGPWIQPLNGGTGPVISVNSWGYTSSPGMAGPKLSETSANCVFANAKSEAIGDFADGDAGYAVNCQ